MTRRIDPIGPYDRAAYPVRRVEREQRPSGEQDEDRRHRFEDQLERGLRERHHEPGPEHDAAGPRTPPPDDGRPHIDISV